MIQAARTTKRHYKRIKYMIKFMNKIKLGPTDALETKHSGACCFRKRIIHSVVTRTVVTAPAAADYFTIAARHSVLF